MAMELVAGLYAPSWADRGWLDCRLADRPMRVVGSRLAAPRAVLTAALVSLFVGWRMAAHIPDAELSGLSPLMRRLLMLALRYLCPVGITVVLLVTLAAVALLQFFVLDRKAHY